MRSKTAALSSNVALAGNLVVDRSGGAHRMTARRHEKLRPQDEAQVGRLVSAGFWLLAELIERPP